LVDPVVLVLMEILCAVGGASALLFGYGVLPRPPEERLRVGPYQQRWGWALRFSGFLALAIGVFLLADAFGPPVVRQNLHWAGVALVGALAVLIARTWRREPKVGWPRGFVGWLGFVVGGFFTGAILLILADKVAGHRLFPHMPPLWLILVVGLPVGRVLSVWITRLRHLREEPLEDRLR
jgi:hypothetical protein